MRLGETAVVLRADGGRLRFDPIDARLNEGALHLEPEVVRAKDGPFRLKLGPASTLEDAVVNDEVSHRVLSYVAPVLDGATRVQGRVSVRRARRGIPARARRPGRPRASRATCSSTRSGSCPVRSPRRSSTCSRTQEAEAGPADAGAPRPDLVPHRRAEGLPARADRPAGPDRLGRAGGLGRFRETPRPRGPIPRQSAPGRPAVAGGAAEQRPLRAADPGDARRSPDRRGGA